MKNKVNNLLGEIIFMLPASVLFFVTISAMVIGDFLKALEALVQTFGVGGIILSLALFVTWIMSYAFHKQEGIGS